MKFQGSSQRLDSQSESDAFSQAGDNYSQKSSPSPISTPHLSKRKSVHDRKLRPKSVVDGSEDYAPGKWTKSPSKSSPYSRLFSLCL